MDRFQKRMGAHTGVEDRIARKFGLVYAAGRMSIEAGLLNWSMGRPMIATQVLYHRAKELRLHGDMQLNKALTKLVEALNDRTLVPLVRPGTRLNIPTGGSLLGVRYRQDGSELVGLRKEGLVALVGASMVNPVLEKLRERGAVIKGHGGKSTQQLPVVLKIGDKAPSKPRFLVIDPKRLMA
jgi:hypothetical protein